MEFKKDKLVRFHHDGSQYTDTNIVEKPLPMFKVTAPLLKSEGKLAERNRTATTPYETFKFGKFNIFPDNHGQSLPCWIIDPGSDIILKWNKIFMFSCLVVLFVDPLFFYIAFVENTGSNLTCMATDLNLAIILTCFRTLADVFYLLHMIIKFRTAYVSPSSRVFGMGELVMDPKRIAVRYLRSDFIIDLIATLPLPQILFWFIIPAALRSSHSDHTNNQIVLIVLVQYIPRLYLIFPLISQIVKATGLVTKTAWAGAAYNLILYMLASHIIGASWYLLSIERHATCWKSVCKTELTPVKCIFHFFGCDSLNDDDRIIWANNTLAYSNCDPNNNSSYFQYGIFGIAVSKNVISTDFVNKYFYSLWWGLQNLSSNGQNLSTSIYIGENSFAILIDIASLILVAGLIGNMQIYMQSITVRLEEWRLKRRDTEEWMRHRQLPPVLQKRVRRFVQYKWVATRGVDDELILRSLPMDLRRDIQRYLCLDLVRRVPFFSQMDDQLLDAICERLTSSLSIQGTYIVHEGDPVTEMLFIIRGRLQSSTTNGGRTGFFNSITLRPGEFCGEELLAWALHPKSTLNRPSSTRTVRALVEVEAFALRAEDLKFVANQFRCLHSKKLQHTFRFYSYQWRTWAACFIQSAWRKYKKRVLAKTLSIKESFSSDFHNERMEGNYNFGVTILASRFASNAWREMSQLQKPDEPDFSTEMDFE